MVRWRLGWREAMRTVDDEAGGAVLKSAIGRTNVRSFYVQSPAKRGSSRNHAAAIGLS